MRRKKLLMRLLATALLVGSISPARTMGAEVPEEFQAEWVMMLDETEIKREAEEAEATVKSAEVDENGFIIEDGVLINYIGDDGNVTIPDSVTSIGDSAFCYCDSLTSITIPDGVTSIGKSAFYGCSNMASITIPDGVTSIEDSTFEHCSKLASITIPDGVTSIGAAAFGGCESLTRITIPDGVTSIGDSAFYGCESLTNITIPDNATSIGEFAFCGCNNLTGITIPNNVTDIGTMAFSTCYNLTSINVSEGNENYTSENGILYNANRSELIQCPSGKEGHVTVPDGVTSIEHHAFYYCHITSITIPDSVTNIGYMAFSGGYNLTSINVSEGNGNYTSENGILYNADRSELIQCPSGKEGHITVPDGVTNIGDSAFYSCSSLMSITIPDGVTNIGYMAFSGCDSLTSITIPDGVTSIGDSVFYSCSSLTSITIPDSVTSIGDSAFESCSSLTSITIPNGVTSIGDRAFSGCDSLTSITIPDSVTNIGYMAFFGCYNLTSINVSEENGNYTSENGILYNADKSELIQCPAGKEGHVTVPDGVTSIGDSAFFECSSLTSIAIPDGVTSIEAYAFYRCNSLTSITIPNGMTSIGNCAFCFCSSLTSVTIPDSVTSIGLYIFSDCNEDLIIYCVRDSYAETYAKGFNIMCRYIGEKDTQTITASNNITKTFGDSAFSIGAVIDGDGTLSYVSDNEAVVKVNSEGTITLVGAGTAHITITASETDTYKAVEKVITITVEKKAQTITASDIAKTLGETAFPLNVAVDGDGTLTYISDNPSIAAITENGTVTLVSAGATHITIKAAETANYKAAEKVITVTVKLAETPDKEPEKNKQTITAKNITKNYGDKAFSLGAKTNGGGKLTYQVLNTKIATINKKGKVTIKGCGRTQIKITAAANGDYQAATKTITLTIKPKKLSLTSVKSTKSKAVTVKWKQDKKAKGYIIECSTDKKFKKNVKTVTISKNSAVSKTVTKLKGGKTYYIRACAYTTADGKKIKGSYSKVINVKVKK